MLDSVPLSMAMLGRRPLRVAKVESLGHLAGEDRIIDHGERPPHRCNSSGLLERGQAQALGDTASSPAQQALLQLLQQRKDSLVRQSPRASHDSILDQSTWQGFSEPSYSNRASLDGGATASPGAAVGHFDMDASSLPCCSARSSLDGGGYAASSCQCSARSSLDTGAGGQGPSLAAEERAVVSAFSPPPRTLPLTCGSAVVRPPGRGSIDTAGGLGHPGAPPPASSRPDFWAGGSSCPVGGILSSLEEMEEARAQREAKAQQQQQGGSVDEGAEPESPFQVHQRLLLEPEHHQRQPQQQQQQPPQRPSLQRPPQPAAPPAAQQPLGEAPPAAHPLPPQPPAAADGTAALPAGAAAQLRVTIWEGPGPAPSPLPPRQLGGLKGSKSAHSVAALLQSLAQEAQAGSGASTSRSQPATRTPSIDIDELLDVHGTYGAHIVQERPAEQPQPQNLQDAIRMAAHMSRSSIDLLLDPPHPPPPHGGMGRRPSMELHELLAPPRYSLDSQSSRHSNGSGGRRSLNLTAAAALQLPRGHSHPAPFMTPQHRPMLDAPPSFANLESLSRGMHHAASTNMLVELSASDALTCDTPTTSAAAAAATGGAAMPLGTSASAFASSVVDTSSGAQDDALNLSVGTPQELWLDPDLHDTFGAHALWPPASVDKPLGGGATGAGAAAARRQSGGEDSPRMHQTLGGDPLFGRLSGGAAGGTAAARLAAAGPGGGAQGRPQPTASMDPSTVHGQHSVTVSDPHTNVPSLEFLRQRRVARQKLDASSSGGGYIAEAKRVLSQAMSSADPLETLLVQSSQSGAIGPLLRHLSLVKHDDDALRSGLHTLSLIISNSPNKSIIISFKGQQMLFDILCTTKDLEVQENIVQVLWDLESASEGSAGKDCTPDPKCYQCFLSLLERTRSAAIASHVIHFMYGFRHFPLPGHLLADGARRLVAVVAAYRYRLPDAVQYTLGLLLMAMLDDAEMAEQDVAAACADMLRLLLGCRHTVQCQTALTLLSCTASSARCRAALCHCAARAKLLQFGQRVTDARLRARALSLVKVLNKEEQQAQQAAQQ